ncbi:MAG: hypothetical protein R2719_12120 [Micropruina sp.]
MLGLATGSSPLAIYDDLAARHAAGEVSFAQARGSPWTSTSACRRTIRRPTTT